jgi:hypothetical protein
MTKKEFVKETYEIVCSADKDGIVVNVYKPKTMRDLPSGLIEHCLSHGHHCEFSDKGSWFGDNPDYGIFDALLTNHQHGNTVDCCVTAILVRPFSKDAFDAYGDILERRLDAKDIERLRDIFDSRVYDEALTR